MKLIWIQERLKLEYFDFEDEVLYLGNRRTTPEEMKVRNPAFDVTPHELVTGLIAEKGIIRAPFADNLLKEYL